MTMTDAMRRSALTAVVAWAISLTVAVAVWVVRIGPDYAAIRVVRGRMDVGDAQVRRMRRALDRGVGRQAELARLQGELHSITNAHLLTPLLNSYAMSAHERLEPVAKGAGLSIQRAQIQELYRIPLPTAEADSDLWFDRLGISVSGTGSYDAIAAFLWDVEERFPYVTLTGLHIAAQHATPEVHRVQLDLEWPVQGSRPPRPAAPRRTR